LIKDIIIQLAKSFVRKTNKVQWHNLRSTEPVAADFGFQRGTPVDRYYIEKFLESNKSKIKGAVLEIAESVYSKKFGTGVTSFEVLHADPDFKGATMIGDLSQPASLASDKVDCFICTQTFNFIFDVQKAVEGSYKLLKPGGTLLATVSGLSQISRYDMDRWGDYWRFTDLSIRKIFENVFSKEKIKIQIFGNVLAATSLLQGITLEELTTDELDVADKNYQVIIAIIAEK
jgi:hypothetical protein